MTSSRRNRYRPWDVVLVPFPYSDRVQARVRPAVVVSSPTLPRATGMYFVAMITNAAHEPWVGDVAVSDLRSAGLPVPSVVRPAKIATIDEGSLIRVIGVLPAPDRLGVASAIDSFLDIRSEVP